MNRPYLHAVLAVLVAAPMAFAHTNGDPYGIPKRYCEDIKGDQKYHDYGPSTGFVIFLGNDGSLESCPYSENDPVNSTFDGHYEHAFGGAWLVSGTNDAAAAACGWPYPDHNAFPTVWVWDHVLSNIPADVSFSVYSDTLNNIPPIDPNEPNCGDFESDYGADCVNHCTIGFPPGLDQTYQVYVSGFAGHVWTDGPPIPTPRPCTLPTVFEVGVNAPSGAPGNPPSDAYVGGVELEFYPGDGRVIINEVVALKFGEPPRNPNPIIHGPHLLERHYWTIGGSNDTLTREFTIDFDAICTATGNVHHVTKSVKVYN